MKMPGVSLIAVARPMPIPAHLLPPGSSRSRSTATRKSSSVLTWPKLIVSRIGSKAATRHSATAKANQRVQPTRRDTGSSSHQTSTALVSTPAATLTTIAACQDRYAIGSITRAAKGGYVKPYWVPGLR